MSESVRADSKPDYVNARYYAIYRLLQPVSSY